MSREILLSARGAALLVRGRLEDLILDPPLDDTTPVPGDIHRAAVDRLVPKMGAAFVRLGGGAQGFLREGRGLREGQRLLVQVVSVPEPGKAAPVTRRVLYKGRTVIHTPDAPGVNVSRRIRDEAERARLAATLSDALETARATAGEALSGSGLIARSAAEGAPGEDLRRETESLIRAHLAALSGNDGGDPGRIGTRPPVSAATIALSEWTDPLPDRIVADAALRERLAGGGRDAEAALASTTGAELARRVEPARGDPFEERGVIDEIDRLRSPRIDLPSGGRLAVEATAALVAVDVDTAGGFGSGDGLTASLEAARELPRQLRLRGLGGQVVVDFAPVPKKDRRRVEDALATAFRRDPVETSLHGWTTMGLFEIQRKRERRPLSELLG